MKNRKKLATVSILFPFMLCAGFLMLLGKCFHLTYKQISVYFNLYLQGILLIVSGGMPLCAAVYALCCTPSPLHVLMVMVFAAYWSIYIVGGICLFLHYKGRADDAFALCVKDLLWIAGRWNVSYHAVNLIIFVLWWLALLGVNFTLFYFTVSY